MLSLIKRGEFALEGLRNADIQGALFRGQAHTAQQRRRRSSAAGRYLRLLRAHRLIRKIPGRHRYVVTAAGGEAPIAILTARHADAAKLTELAAA